MVDNSIAFQLSTSKHQNENLNKWFASTMFCNKQLVEKKKVKKKIGLLIERMKMERNGIES